MKRNEFICDKCLDIPEWYVEENEHCSCQVCTGHTWNCDGKYHDTGKTYEQWKHKFLKDNPNYTQDDFDDDDEVFNILLDYIRERMKPRFLDTFDERAYNDRIKEYQRYDDIANENQKLWLINKTCPNCGSANSHEEKKGFSGKKAVIAGLATGFVDVGLAAGLIGSNKKIHVCNQCGHKW